MNIIKICNLIFLLIIISLYVVCEKLSANEQEVLFRSVKDGVKLRGTLTLPMGNDQEIPGIVLAHGSGSHGRDMSVAGGVPAKELFYHSQVALAKASGFKGESFPQMDSIYEEFWKVISKTTLTYIERKKGLDLLRRLWGYVDRSSREDFGLIERNIEFMFDNMYHHKNVIRFMKYDPRKILKEVTCPVLALNGDKDCQVTAKVNLFSIRRALKDGKCPEY